MKTSTFISLLAATAAAAPLEVRDGPHGGMAGMTGMTDTPAGDAAAAPAGFDLGSLLQGIDMSKIGEMLQGVDMSKIGELMQGFDMSKIGDLLQGVDMSKIGDLMKGFDMSKIGDLMKGADMSSLASAVPPEVISQYSGAFMKNLQSLKASKVEDMKPLLRPEAKRVKIIYGPYVIKGTENKAKVGNGFSLDPAGTGYMYSTDQDFPRDITIIDVKSGIFDEDFIPIDIGKGLYNHHNVFYDTSKQDPKIVSCGDGKATGGIPMSIFMGGATETTNMPYTSADGKFNSGYYIGKDASIANMIDIVNYNKEDRKVYQVSEMEYVPGKISDALPSTSQVIEIGTCSKAGEGMLIHPPEGVKQWSMNSSNMTIAKDGYFLAARAHLHDGGVGMQLYLNGKEICNSVAEYGGPGREGKNPDGTVWKGIGGTKSCNEVVPVKAGDILRMTASFDVEAHPERQFEKGEAHGDSHGDEKGEMGMAEGMALFNVAFALQEPGTDPKYLFKSS